MSVRADRPEFSLRLRKVQWKQVGFTRYRTWAKTLLLGVACGVGLELFDLFVKQPLLTRLLGKPPDLSNFAAVKGNLRFALVIIALLWVLAAFGEELVYRGYLMNRVADFGHGTRTAWVVSLFLISALFGFAHYQQGLTGIIEEGSDGLILGCIILPVAATSPFRLSPTEFAIPSTSLYFSWASIPGCSKYWEPSYR